MTLFHETSGSGEPLVLLHGWGLNHTVWRLSAEALAPSFRICNIDLPGHGQSPLPDTGYTLDNTSDMIAATIEPGSIIVAWSLGGLMAMNMAIHDSSKIKNLILVSSSAQFAASDDWPHGMMPDVLSGFAKELKQDYEGTIKRFLSLQSMGSLRAKEEIRFLREALVDTEHLPKSEALIGGLNLLKSTNLRPHCHKIKCPTLIINGERDRLVNPATGKAMSQDIPKSQHVVIKDAGHAPFISHAEIFNDLVEKFINE